MRTKKSKQLVREELKKVLYKRMLTENTNPFKKGDSVVVVKVFGSTHAKQSEARRFTGKKGIINDIQGDYVFVNLKGFRSPSIEFHKNEIDWTDVINENSAERFYKSAGKTIAKRVDVHKLIDLYSTDEDAAYDMLMNRLDTTPLGSKLKDDEKQKVVAYAMDELALTKQLNEGVDEDVEIIHVKASEGAKKLGYGDGDVFYMISYNKNEPALDPMITLRYGNHEKMTKIYDDEAKFQQTLAKIRSKAIDGPINEERTSTISKARAKSSLKQIEKGKRDDGMGKFDAKVYAKKDDNEVELKKLADLDKHSSGYTYHLKENELPYKLGGKAKSVMIDMDTVIDVLSKDETDENVLALIGELPPGPLEHLAFIDKWLRFEKYYEETDSEKLSKLLIQDLRLNDDEVQIIVDDYVNKRKNIEHDAWYETHDEHTEDEEWSGPAGGADVTPEEVHQAAEQAGIAWDGDEAFMDFSEKITGVRHIDTMNSELRFKLIDALKQAVPQAI